MVLGFSPAAILPALGLLREGRFDLLLLLGALVLVTQTYSWTKASREAERLENLLRRMQEEDGGVPHVAEVLPDSRGEGL